MPIDPARTPRASSSCGYSRRRCWRLFPFWMPRPYWAVATVYILTGSGATRSGVLSRTGNDNRPHGAIVLNLVSAPEYCAGRCAQVRLPACRQLGGLLRVYLHAAVLTVTSVSSARRWRRCRNFAHFALWLDHPCCRTAVAAMSMPSETSLDVLKRAAGGENGEFCGAPADAVEIDIWPVVQRLD